MKIVVAKKSGFCMGVRRAVEMALDAPSKYEKPIYTFGPIIHNPQVLAMFAERGISVLKHIPDQGNGTVLVRAHGVPPETKQQLKDAGFKVIDATCPRVVKVQSIIKSHTRKGYATIIVGDQDHPEVISLLGFSDNKGFVVGTLDEFRALPQLEQAIVVAQTTQNQMFYQEVKAWAAAHAPHYEVFDTICDSTEKRQAEVRCLAQQVDAVVVVGGKNSGNTKRLAEIVIDSGRPAYHIESESELNISTLSTMQSVGVAAGASTPAWIIKGVVRELEQMPMHRRKGLKSFVMRLQRLMLLTNIYLAFGAACLCYTATHLQGLPLSIPALSVAMLYVLSMHLLNHLTGRAEDRYNDPSRERFYNRYKILLTTMALCSGALGLVAAFQMGALPFWALLIMSLLGLSYNLRFLPTSFGPGLKIRRIRDLPGSKTLLIALAWGIVTAGLPAMAYGHWQFYSGSFAVVWATGMAFCRTAFFDILDMHGDRIVGKETIPTLLGPERSLWLLNVALGATVFLLLAGGCWGILTPLAFFQLLGPFFLWIVVTLYQKGHLLPGMQLAFFVDSLFLFTGAVTLIYSVMT